MFTPLTARSNYLHSKIAMSQGKNNDALVYAKRAYAATSKDHLIRYVNNSEYSLFPIYTTSILAFSYINSGDKISGLKLADIIKTFPSYTSRYRDIQLAKIYYAAGEYDMASKALDDVGGIGSSRALTIARGLLHLPMCTFSILACVDSVSISTQGALLKDPLKADSTYIRAAILVKQQHINDANLILESLLSSEMATNRPDLYVRVLLLKRQIAVINRDMPAVQDFDEKVQNILAHKDMQKMQRHLFLVTITAQFQ